MDYYFSWGWFLVGIIIAAIGATILRYFVWFAENFGAGAGSYDRVKLVGLIVSGIGLLVMFNLHLFLLRLVLSLVFPNI